MVGPPSDVKPSGCGLFCFRPPWHKEGASMRLLGDLVVYAGAVAIVGFFVYIAIKSRMDAKKDSSKPQ